MSLRPIQKAGQSTKAGNKRREAFNTRDFWKNTTYTPVNYNTSAGHYKYILGKYNIYADQLYFMCGTTH